MAQVREDGIGAKIEKLAPNSLMGRAKGRVESVARVVESSSKLHMYSTIFLLVRDHAASAGTYLAIRQAGIEQLSTGFGQSGVRPFVWVLNLNNKLCQRDGSENPRENLYHDR
jgi:hypothetical protein